jgi:DNA repair protein RecO (recombination protein O)
MHLFRMSHLDRQRLLEIAISYYRLHLPDFPELKSLAVLLEIYQ